MTPAEIRALQAEILTGSKSLDCAPYVVTNDMPKDPAGGAKDQAIADILNAYLPDTFARHEVGDGAICIALGTPAGPVFIYRLKKFAASVLADDASIEQVAPLAVAQQAVNSLAKGGFDVGDPEVRKGIDLFVGPLLSLEHAEKIKALAPLVPSSITAADVSRALRGPWE